MEYKKQIPFLVKRSFIVHNVPSKEVRGEHAHKKIHQFLLCLQGTLSVIVDDGKKRLEIPLKPFEVGVHIGPMVWSVQYKYTKDAMLLVFASEKYDPDEYIRNYSEFIKKARKNHAG
jgi:hypothetical protein